MSASFPSDLLLFAGLVIEHRRRPFLGLNTERNFLEPVGVAARRAPKALGFDLELTGR
jgi:hypothetical protein